MITTPLLLLSLAWVALGGIGRNPRLVGYIVGADVLMIITGLFAGYSTGGFKTFWFIVSSLFFLAVLYFIWGPANSLLAESRRGTTEGGPGLFFTLAAMLTLIWILYPIVFLLGPEGGGAAGEGFSTFLYAVLDIGAKIAFGFVLLDGIRRARGTTA